MSLACSLKVFLKPRASSPRSLDKSASSKDWWKKCFNQNSVVTKFYDDDITAVQLGGPETHSSSNSQKSFTCAQDTGKLFPRNMPSIRRSRRRLIQKPIASEQQDQEMQNSEGSCNKSSVSKVTKLTPKKLKANCSKKRGNNSTKLNPAGSLTKPAAGKKSLTKTKKSPLVQGNLKLSLLPHDISLDTNILDELPGTSQHSQFSSLISYDLKSTASQQSCLQTTSGQQRCLLQPEDMFHSSGISCNDETPSEASCSSLQVTDLHNLDVSLSAEEALIEAEVAQLTDSLARAQKQHKYPSSVLLPVSELANLNVCRNRQALWVHSWSEEASQPAANAPSVDDIQLSDLEEQLALVHARTVTAPARTATYKV